MLKINKIHKQEEGFASIVIALTMIIVLALLVVGFAQLARKEQQSALDKQLSAQAYYAAETGINDVRKLIDEGTINSVTNVGTDECLKGAAIDATKNINTDTGVAYTCVIANMSPKELRFDGLLADTSKIANFQTVNDSGAQVALSSLKIEWSSEGSSALPSGSSFLPLNDWKNNHYPSVVQFALTPYTASGGAARNALISNTATTYLYPASTPSVSNYAALKGTGSGTISKATCSGGKCSVTMTGINAAGSVDNYLIHLINMYVKSNVTITGKDTTGNDVRFKGAQAMVDVTGKARNVLKRLQVRIPLNSSVNLPGYALEAQNICKRMETEPNSTTFSVPSGAGSAGDSCKIDQ